MADKMTIRGYLVVRADGVMRIIKRPVLRVDEVAFPLTVTIPNTWGLVQDTAIEVALPEPPQARVTVGEPELSTDD